MGSVKLIFSEIFRFQNLILLIFTQLPVCLFGQTEQLKSIENRARVEIKVVDTTMPSATFNLMVVNKRTQQGFFADPSGSFSLYMEKTDTIMIGAVGYRTHLFYLKDTSSRNEYKFTINIERLQVNLKTVEIFSKRELSEIQKDIQKLGYKESDYKLSGVDAYQSPLTFLYQAFSRREKHKRQVAEWKNEDRKRALLKELLVQYVDVGIIKLNDENFDNFIDFCAVSEDFMKSASQYDFVMYIKKRFEIYSMMQQTKN